MNEGKSKQRQTQRIVDSGLGTRNVELVCVLGLDPSNVESLENAGNPMYNQCPNGACKNSMGFGFIPSADNGCAHCQSETNCDQRFGRKCEKLEVLMPISSDRKNNMKTKPKPKCKLNKARAKRDSGENEDKTSKNSGEDFHEIMRDTIEESVKDSFEEIFRCYFSTIMEKLDRLNIQSNRNYLILLDKIEYYTDRTTQQFEYLCSRLNQSSWMMAQQNQQLQCACCAMPRFHLCQHGNNNNNNNNNDNDNNNNTTNSMKSSQHELAFKNSSKCNLCFDSTGKNVNKISKSINSFNNKNKNNNSSKNTADQSTMKPISSTSSSDDESSDYEIGVGRNKVRQKSRKSTC